MATPSLPQPPPGKIQRIFTWQVTLNNSVANLPYRIQYSDVIYVSATRKNPDKSGSIDAYNFVWASGSPAPYPGGMPVLLQPENIGTNDPRIGCAAHAEVFMAVYRGLAYWDRQDWSGVIAEDNTGAWEGTPLVLQTVLPASTIPLPSASDVVILEEYDAGVVPEQTGTNSFTIGPFKTDDTTIEKLWEYDYPNAPHGEGIPSPLSTRNGVWERRPSTTTVPSNRFYSSPCQWRSGNYAYDYNWGSGLSSYRRRITTSLKSTVARPPMNALKSYGYVNRLTSPAKTPLSSLVSYGVVPFLKTPGIDRRSLVAVVSYGSPQHLSSPYHPAIQALVSYGQAPTLRVNPTPYTPPLNALVSIGAANPLQIGAVKVPLGSPASYGHIPSLERTDVVPADQFFPGGFARVPIGGVMP